MIAVGFAIVCALLYAAAAAFFARAMVIGVRVSQRAKTMVPHALLSQLRFAQLDAKRTAKTVKEASALAPRAAVASASILESISFYRALLARLGLA